MHTISLPVSGPLRFHTQTKTGANMARSPSTLHQREYGRAEWLDRENDSSLAVAIPIAPSRQLCHLFACAAPLANVFARTNFDDSRPPIKYAVLGGMTEWKQYSSNSSSLLLCISLSCLCLLQRVEISTTKLIEGNMTTIVMKKLLEMNGIMRSNNMMGYKSEKYLFIDPLAG